MVKAHKDAWPFEEPVTEEDAPGYHDIIRVRQEVLKVIQKLSEKFVY